MQLCLTFLGIHLCWLTDWCSTSGLGTPTNVHASDKLFANVIVLIGRLKCSSMAAAGSKRSHLLTDLAFQHPWLSRLSRKHVLGHTCMNYASWKQTFCQLLQCMSCDATAMSLGTTCTGARPLIRPLCFQWLCVLRSHPLYAHLWWLLLPRL